jgi:hypothetical protein
MAALIGVDVIDILSKWTGPAGDFWKKLVVHSS